jgi:hypothetical protein
MKTVLSNSAIRISAADVTLKPSKVVVDAGRVSYRNDRLVRVWVFFENTKDQDAWFGNVAEVALAIP